MTRQELYNEVLTAHARVNSVSKSGKSSQKEREFLKNLLYSNVQTILEALGGETVVSEIDPEEVQELKEELEAGGDALAETDQKVKVLKFLMREHDLDPNALLAEYEENMAKEIAAKDAKKGGKK